MGAAWGPFGDYFFVGAGNDDKVYRYGFQNDSAWFVSSTSLAVDDQKTFISPTGLAVNSDGDKIFTVAYHPDRLPIECVYQFGDQETGISRTALHVRSR